MSNLIALVGPTGSGKSRLGLELARKFNLEIVGADSRQIYRAMDIGTAKPGLDDLAAVRHHLINIRDPGDAFSLAEYQEMACRAIGDIQRSNKTPLLVGGTGQYVWAVVEGWEIPRVAPDMDFRRQLEKKVAEGGAAGLYQQLQLIDPAAAQKIDRRNIRRVIRALEVNQKARVPISQLQRKKGSPYNVLIVGLTADRQALYRRVDARVDEMMGQGFQIEVETLVRQGFGLDRPAMSSIGYQQLGKVWQGKLSLAEAVQQIKNETHRFIRHQYAWFRLKDPRIKWFDIQSDPGAEIDSLVAGFLETGACP